MKFYTIDSVLQPLRVPAGWKIEYNIFSQFEPTPDNMEFFYGEWLLLASHELNKVGIELRYEPEGDPSGQFVLEYFSLEKSSARRPLSLKEEVLTRSKSDVVAAIERIMSSSIAPGGES